MILSSLLFAILHAEILGHFLFGVMMALLYLRTHSLWIPIIAHAINNAIVALSMLPVALSGGLPSRTMSLAEFRAGWGEGVMMVGVTIVLAWVYLRIYWPPGMIRVLLHSSTPYTAWLERQTFGTLAFSRAPMQHPA